MIQEHNLGCVAELPVGEIKIRDSNSRAANAYFGFLPPNYLSYPAFRLRRIIQLGIVPKDAFLIERQTPLG